MQQFETPPQVKPGHPPGFLPDGGSQKINVSCPQSTGCGLNSLIPHSIRDLGHSDLGRQPAHGTRDTAPSHRLSSSAPLTGTAIASSSRALADVLDGLAGPLVAAPLARGAVARELVIVLVQGPERSYF